MSKDIVSKHTADKLSKGFRYSESRSFLIEEITFDQIALEKKISEKIEKAVSEMASSQFEDDSIGGYNYAASDIDPDLVPVDGTQKNRRLSGLTMPIFDIEAVEKRMQHDPSSTGDRDERRARFQLLEMIAESGPNRKLARVELDTETRLDGLEEDFPNFSEVIQYLRGVVAIAHADDRTAQPAHLLLCGPPGIGKTLFSQCIANILGTEMHIAHLETMQTSADLVGTSSHYSSAQTGLVFNALVGGEYANPLILLDELDKATGDYKSPTSSALYSLPEETSKTFCDECEQWLELDASRVMYIGTTNDLDCIEPALLSRFRVFEIAAPSRDECRLIIGSIFSEIKHRRPRAFENLRLTDAAAEKLLDLSPRQMKRALNTAAANALIAQRMHIHPIDVEAEPQLKRQRIGFVS